MQETYPTINVHADNDSAFRVACEGGHLETAKWLVGSCGPVDVHAYNDNAFRVACGRGHLETARWLVSLDLDWPHWDLLPIKAWSRARDAWTHAVVFV